MGDPLPALAAGLQRQPAAGDETAALDLELLRLFADYWSELVPADESPLSFGLQAVASPSLANFARGRRYCCPRRTTSAPPGQ